MASGKEIVPTPTGAARLDKLLASWPTVGSRRRAREAVASGKVTIDGQPVGVTEMGLPVSPGAQVEIAWNRPGSGRAADRANRQLARAGLRVLYEDAEVVCIHKPAGLLTDTATAAQARDQDSARQQLQAWLAPLGETALVCHRIDRDTTGVVVFARHPDAHRALREAFTQHLPERVYWAAIHGALDREWGTWEDLLVWDSERLRQRRARSPEEAGAAVARASYRVLEAHRLASIVEVRLETGLRNQIRLQAALAGCPLVGERLYLPAGWTPREPPLRFGRQALHALRVVFPHPSTGAPITVTSPLPPDLLALRAQIRRAK